MPPSSLETARHSKPLLLLLGAVDGQFTALLKQVVNPIQDSKSAGATNTPPAATKPPSAPPVEPVCRSRSTVGSLYGRDVYVSFTNTSSHAFARSGREVKKPRRLDQAACEPQPGLQSQSRATNMPDRELEAAPGGITSPSERGRRETKAALNQTLKKNRKRSNKGVDHCMLMLPRRYLYTLSAGALTVCLCSYCACCKLNIRWMNAASLCVATLRCALTNGWHCRRQEEQWRRMVAEAATSSSAASVSSFLQQARGCCTTRGS